jgi:hypothetical protein
VCVCVCVLMLAGCSETLAGGALARGAQGNATDMKVRLPVGLDKIPWRTPGQVEANFHVLGGGKGSASSSGHFIPEERAPGVH